MTYIIKLWTFNIELPPRLYRCRWRIAYIVAIVDKAPINSNCFAGLSRGAGLFLSNSLYFDMLDTSSNHGIISLLFPTCVWQLYLKRNTVKAFRIYKFEPQKATHGIGQRPLLAKNCLSRKAILTMVYDSMTIYIHIYIQI